MVGVTLTVDVPDWPGLLIVTPVGAGVRAIDAPGGVRVEVTITVPEEMA